MKKGICLLIIVLFAIQPSSAAYYESDSYFTFDGTEYYYTAELTYTRYYYGETIFLDTEIVVDFFGIDSYSFFDIEMFIRGEDTSGFLVFEDSHFTGLDIILDGESVVVEWDILIGTDYPSSIDLYVAADFYEETAFSDEFYSDDWVFITTISISSGARGSSTNFSFDIFLISTIFLLTFNKIRINRKLK